MGKLELVQAFQMEQENEHLQAYKKAFPYHRPTIFQMELIEANVKDGQAWKRTLEFWAGNDYRPQSVQKMIEYYRQQVNPKLDVGRPIQREYHPEPPCKYCGNEYCFKDHRAEILAEQAA
jgi:hypothetical protein